MGIVYPDNQNRANRVQQLAGDIARLQTQVRETVADAKTQDERAIAMLDQIAKQRGFKTLDDYIKDMESKLSPKEKAEYDNIKKELEKKDQDLDIAMKVGSGIVGIGVTAGMTAVSIAALVERTMVTLTLKAVGVGLLKILTGQMKEGVALFKAAGKILSTVMKGERLAGKVATAFRALKVAGKVLSVLGVALDLGVLIYEAVDGAKQRKELQDAIKELCVRRMTTKKIQQYTRITLTFASEGNANADFAKTMQGLVADGTINQKTADEKVAAKLKELEPKIGKAIEEVNDKTVYESLALQDKESQTAWTNEDPSLDWIISKIEEDAKKEAD